MRSYFIEQRRWPRVEVDARGRIINVSRGLRIANVVPCTIIDISEGGAQIESDSGEIGDNFYLEMESEPENRATCTVVWRRGNRAGVKFV